MPLADIVIVGVILFFIIIGLRSGFIHTLGSLAGTILGIYMAGHYYDPLARWLISFTGWSENFVRILTFVIVFVLINRIVGILFWTADRVLGLISRLPILSGFDRLLGAVLGALEGIIVVGIALFFITKFPPSESFMRELDKSQLAPKIIVFSAFLWPLLPKEVTSMVGDLGSTFNLPKLTIPQELENLKNFAFPAQNPPPAPGK